jgi:hypothetical protein
MMASPRKEEYIKSLTKLRKKHTLLPMDDHHLLIRRLYPKNSYKNTYSGVGNPDPSISQLDMI